MKKNYLLVIIQFACLFFFIFSGSLLGNSIVLISVQVISILLGIWAIITMRFSNLTVMPEPKSSATLIMKGPYTKIRHPMYTSILLLCFTFLINSFTIFRLLIFVLLLVNQIIKINYEETLLELKFIDYSTYKRKSWRLIPFIY